MKGLKKIALVTAIAAAPFAAHADLQVMDDASLSATTGQAGLTIDLTADVNIGEVAYQDAGFISIRDISISGIETTITVDVAGASDAASFTPVTGGTAILDGDLVVSLSETDYALKVGSVSLQQEAYGTTDLGMGADLAGKTVLVSGIDLTGSIGGVDVVIHEASGDMDIAATFNATSVGGTETMTFDFLNVTVDEFTIGNMRGDGDNTAGGGNGYASVAMTVGTTLVGGADSKGIFINVSEFKADIDLVDIGIGGSLIGSLYITDLEVVATMDVYGH